MLSTFPRYLSRAHLSARRLGAVGVAAGLVAVGLSAAPASAAPADVRFVFDQPRGVMTTPSNMGTAPTRQRIVRANGGQVYVYPSFRGSGNAAGLPASDPARDGRRAAIAVTNAGSTDRLSPGTRRFSFGATVRMSTVSGSSVYDDGNNILQRGLYFAPSQYKVQIEKGRASCRIKGSGGAVQIQSGVAIRQHRWYGIFCSRVPGSTGATVSISVTPISDRGVRGRTVTNTKTGVVGAVTFPIRTPLSIGAKMSTSSTIVTESDQFNGRIDNAYLNIR